MRLSPRQAYDSTMRQCRGPAPRDLHGLPLLAHRAIVGDDHCYVLVHSGSLAHVESREHAQVVAHLFAMAMALSVGALLLGVLTDRFRCRGVSPQTLLAAMAGGAVLLAQLAIITRAPIPAYSA